MTGSGLKSSSLTGCDVKDHSLTPSDLSSSLIDLLLAMTG
jgi:hypothetical protein